MEFKRDTVLHLLLNVTDGFFKVLSDIVESM